MTEQPQCEQCDEPATRTDRKLKEGEPVTDEKGQKWATWEYDGPRQYWCEDHAPLYPYNIPPITTFPIWLFMNDRKVPK